MTGASSAQPKRPEKAEALYAELIRDYADNDLAKKAVVERAELPPPAAASLMIRRLK